MILIGELIDRVQSSYSKGVKSDDSRLSSRLIYNKLLSVRSALITQQIKKHQFISDWNYAVLSCIELIEVENHDCPCIPSIGCKVYRTKHKLPKMLTDLNEHVIKWVMTIDRNKIISQITREAYLYNQGNKYTANNLKYIIENGYIYVYGKYIPKVISLKFLPENPLEVYKFPNICKDCIDCDNCQSIQEKVFQIDFDLIEPLIQMSYEELIAKFNANVEDKTNNSSDNIREQSK